MGVPNALVTRHARGGRTFPSAESKGRSKYSARRLAVGTAVRLREAGCGHVRQVRPGEGYRSSRLDWWRAKVGAAAAWMGCCIRTVPTITALTTSEANDRQ